MSKEMEFFILLLEQYAYSKGKGADEVLKQWESLGISDLIFDMYERYHQEAIENAFTDIDQLIINTQDKSGTTA